MPLSLKNLLIKKPDPLPVQENVPAPDEFAQVTEAMAERLAKRTPNLLKALNALHKKDTTPQNQARDLQEWVDREQQEIANLKRAIWERKQAFLRGVSRDEKSRLSRRHPVWASIYFLYLHQIKDLYTVHKNESTIIRCVVDPQVLHFLKIFLYASGNNAISIDSRKAATPSDLDKSAHETAKPDGGAGGHDPAGAYIFRSLPGGHARWTFTGNRWGIDEHIVWLDFGKSQGY